MMETSHREEEVAPGRVYDPHSHSPGELRGPDLSQRHLARAPPDSSVSLGGWGDGLHWYQLLFWLQVLCFMHSTISFYSAPLLCWASCQGPGNMVMNKAGTVPVHTECVVQRRSLMLIEHLRK